MNKKLIEREKKIGDRWSKGIPHHPKTEELIRAIMDIDLYCYNDYFCWKYGGDGDNGETLAYQLDAYFESQDEKQT